MNKILTIGKDDLKKYQGYLARLIYVQHPFEEDLLGFEGTLIFENNKFKLVMFFDDGDVADEINLIDGNKIKILSKTKKITIAKNQEWYDIYGKNRKS